MRVADLPTPALLVDLAALDANLAAMAARWPGPSLRTHVKAFKSTGLARRVVDAGHPAFCCATPREVLGMAAAGLGTDLLLANETLDPDRLAAMAGTVARGEARVTVAVDSPETLVAAADAGIGEVLVDVNVGLPRCGCQVDDAAALAAAARRRGLEVRGVMGYEGHVVPIDDLDERRAAVEVSMARLVAAHEQVGGPIRSGGATATWAINEWVTEVQAGSFLLMDTTYAKQADLPFTRALGVLGTVVSTNRRERFAVADVGLKALGMDHGNPRIEDQRVWVCSDEHVTFAPRDDAPLPSVGDRTVVWPAHVDPTVSQHERLHVVAGGGPAPFEPDAEVVDVWDVDLRNW